MWVEPMRLKKKKRLACETSSHRPPVEENNEDMDMLRILSCSVPLHYCDVDSTKTTEKKIVTAR